MDNLLNFPSLNFIEKYNDYMNKINEIKNHLKNNKFIINDNNLILLQDLYIIEIINNDIYINNFEIEELTINITNPIYKGIFFKNDCNIKQLDINAKYIKKIICEKILLQRIKLHCNKLKEIICNNNYLSYINFNKCKNISNINCSNNRIKNIKINKCFKLNELNAKINNIENITFNNLSIKIINLKNNKINNINIINCPKIEKLNLNYNIIKNLILSNMYFIKKINVLNNPIRKINLNNIGNNTGYIDIKYDSNIEIKNSSIFDMSKSFNNTVLLEPNKSNIIYTNYKSYNKYIEFMNDLKMII